MTGVNRNPLFLQSQRIMIKTPIEKIEEDDLEVSEENPKVPTPAKEEDENVKPFMALDHKTILDMNNIHIISKVKLEKDKEKEEEKEKGVNEKLDKGDKFVDDKFVIEDEGDSGNTGGTDGMTLEEILTKLEGNEFDKEVTQEEAESVIKQFTDLLKSDLKAKYGFSDEFLNEVVEFAVTELGLGNTTMGIIGQGQKKYNLKNLLNSVKKDMESLTGEAVYHKEREEIYDENGNITGWQIRKWNLLDEYLANPNYTMSFIKGNYFLLGDYDDPYNKQNNFMFNLFNNTYEKLGISSFDEKEAFADLILKSISQKIGIPADQITPKDIMAKLDSNSNDSWIDEVYDIVNQVALGVNIKGSENVTTIDTNVLFKDGDTIDAKYIADNFGNWILDAQSGLKQLSEILQSALNDMNIYNQYDERDVFDSLIKIINNQLGITNTKPPTLTKNAIEQLNQKDIFSTIENILKSDELKRAYYLDIDGEIDDFGQGSTGDCWLLGGLKAFCSSEQGRQYIKDAIKDNGDGTYTVTFQPYEYCGNVIEGWSGIITYEDIVEARESRKYSHGDADVLLIELAMEKCMLDRVSNPEQWGPASILNGGGAVFIIYALTGSDYIIPEFRGLSPEKLFEYKYNDFKNGDLTLTCGGIEDNISVKDINGKYISIIPNHEYAITDMYKDPYNPSNNTVTIVNPWYSDEPIVLSWEEFMKTHLTVTCFCDRDLINIDDVFEPFINGDINEDDLFGSLWDMALQGVFSDEQKEYIIQKSTSLGLNSQWIEHLMENSSSANPIEQRQHKASKFVKKFDMDALGDKKQEFLEEANKIIEKYANGSMDFESLISQIKILYTSYMGGGTEDINQTEDSQSENVISDAEIAFIKSFTSMSNPFNAKRDDYYRIFLNNYDALGSFDMQPVYVNEKGQYVSTSNPSRGLFSNFVDTVKTLINDIPNGKIILESIGGDNRLREILMNIWNSYAPQSNMDIEWLFNDIFDSIFATYGELESYM